MTAPLSPRLDRTARLLGLDPMERLARAHVVVIGLGGVGSFAAEALARAGVGRLTLCDGERIDETNVNRQLHALEGEVGRYKAEALADRYRRVNAAARIEAVCERYGEETAARIVPAGVDFVVDAADTVVAKLHLISRCLTERIPLVTSMGAARRIDPTAVEVTDLCETHTDQLAKDVRKYLRRHHGISAVSPTGVLAVWSREPPRDTLALPWDEALGVPGVRARPEGERRREPKVFGSAAFVTGVFGLAAAGAVVQRLTGLAPATPRELGEREAKRRKKKVTSPRR
ncbi:tRNA threonylcarbamoyladenosine dehydratase [Anaeromyxobacter paludicola]|uniref:tRNA cyclic N6-threonylcarbamoyladenosine(37) synthase TcdA n=1 Tax=Anaeromyxobacter paludicola TaxID=2918171 RepID=A0ABM7X9H4_9BACT|nr:tRNA threonylcarbamoyladenosine dehydratase [Anaeromyxobacter paludicola]BDG08501.1 tRNA cyclic N6-threonylcarbamoyladenosine(37) synthase TcdA [Anaeromyxobacter paludicola]